MQKLLYKIQKNILFDKDAFKFFLKNRIHQHMPPKSVKIEKIEIGHRFKRSKS